MEEYIKKHYKYVTYLGTDNDLVIYKVSPNMYDDVKYCLEYVYRMRDNGRKYGKKTLAEPEPIHLPVNVDFEKNNPEMLNLIDEMVYDGESYILKMKPMVGQDLKYGLSFVYQKRKRKPFDPADNNSIVKKRPGPRKKITHVNFDYNINIPHDF